MFSRDSFLKKKGFINPNGRLYKGTLGNSYWNWPSFTESGVGIPSKFLVGIP